jgi:polyisoprenoid-binding protein YceI
MKTTVLNIALVALIGLGATACKNNEKEAKTNMEETAQATEAAVDYTVDTNASQIKWEGSKPTTTHHGTLSLSAGNIAVNNGAVEAGTFEVDMTSINVQDLEGDKKSKLEAHLKGTAEGKEGDFFNTTQYPSAKFEMTGIENDIIKGNLTIKGKTNPIEFPAKVSVENDKLIIKSKPFEIDRTKWGVNFGSKSIFPNLGDKFISDDMKITVSLVANKA